MEKKRQLHEPSVTPYGILEGIGESSPVPAPV